VGERAAGEDELPLPSELDDEHVLRAFAESTRAGRPATAPLAAQLHEGVLEVMTPAGTILGMLSSPEAATAGVLLVGGAIGGFGGPAGSVYHELAARLARQRIAALRLHGREPSELDSCVQDALIVLQWWRRQQGVGRVVVVGHSLGGATAIVTGAGEPAVAGVAGLASQTAGTEVVDRLEGRPLLLLHGRRDLVLPYVCSQSIYARAKDPRTLELLDCGHTMREAAGAVVERLERFILETLRG
jgi:pimeloyl-ACP methyl ester carboxylesterase